MGGCSTNTKLDVVLAQEHGMAAHKGDGRLGRHPRPRTPLAEHHGNGLPRQLRPHRRSMLRVGALDEALVGRGVAHE